MVCRNELAFNNKENALAVASMLLDECYVVLLSSEEKLTIINYEGTYEYNEANRNGVVFMGIDEFDTKYCEINDDDDDDEWETPYEK